MKELIQKLRTDHYLHYETCPEGETPEGYEKRKTEGTGFLKAIIIVEDEFRRISLLQQNTPSQNPKEGL